MSEQDNDSINQLPHLHRLVIYLNGDQSSYNLTNSNDFMSSIRNLFNPFEAKPKSNKDNDINKLFHLVTLNDVEEFPLECPICLVPLIDNSQLSKSDLIYKLLKDSLTTKNVLKKGIADDDPLIPFPRDEFDVKLKYFKLKDDSTDDDHELVQINNCKHIFGKSCILTWLKTNNTCPLCRCDVLKSMGNSKEQDDLIQYPVLLSEILLPSTWVDYDDDMIDTPDPDISFPVSSANLHGVTGPRRGPLLDDILQQYSNNSTDSSSGGPMRSNSRNPIRSHPYSRF